MIYMYINVNLINWSTKSFPVPLTKLTFSVNFASMSTSGRQIKYSLNLNSSSKLHDITPNNCTYIHVYTCQIIYLYLRWLLKYSCVRITSWITYVGGTTLNWINAFLCFRQQRVVVNGIKSDWAPVVSGVPQGTVLGPLLFSLYINDISADIESEIRLFADDCVCYREIKNEEDTLKLQRDNLIV